MISFVHGPHSESKRIDMLDEIRSMTKIAKRKIEDTLITKHLKDMNTVNVTSIVVVL